MGRCTLVSQVTSRTSAPPARRARTVSPSLESPPSPPSQRTWQSRNGSDKPIHQRVTELEAGGTWGVLQARAIVEDAADIGDWSLALRALHAFEEADFFAPRSLSTSVLMSLASAGRVEESASLLARLFSTTVPRSGVESPLPDDAIARRQPNMRMVVAAANSAVRMLRVEQAVGIVRLAEAHGLHANSHAYSVLIKGFGRAGRPHDVAATLRTACARTRVDLALFNSAVDAFVRCGQFARARDAMRSAEAAGLALDSRSYNPLLRAAARAGRLADAFALVGEMQARGVAASPVTLNALLQAAVAAREWQAARRLLERALSLPGRAWTRHKAVAYTTLIAGLAADRNISGATALLAEMAAAVREPAGGRAEEAMTAPLSVPLAAILTALLEHGTADEALALFRGTQQRLSLALAPDAYNAVIRGLARRGAANAVAGASELLDEMLDVFWAGGRPSAAGRGRERLPYELTMAHNAVMDGLVRVGDAEGAERLMRSMRARGLLPSAISYTTVLNGYGRQRDLAAARRVLVEMRAEGIPPDRVAMNAFLGACVRAGDIAEATAVFADMRLAGKELAPNLTSYSALIAAHCGAGDSEAAWRAYEDMKKARIHPNERLLGRMLAMCVAGPSEKRSSRGPVSPLLRSRRARSKTWVGERGSILLQDMEKCQCSEESKARWRRRLLSIG